MQKMQYFFPCLIVKQRHRKLCNGRNTSRSESNTNSEEGSLCSFDECQSEDVHHLDSEDVNGVCRSLDITCSVPTLTEGVCEGFWLCGLTACLCWVDIWCRWSALYSKVHAPKGIQCFLQVSFQLGKTCWWKRMMLQHRAQPSPQFKHLLTRFCIFTVCICVHPLSSWGFTVSCIMAAEFADVGTFCGGSVPSHIKVEPSPLRERGCSPFVIIFGGAESWWPTLWNRDCRGAKRQCKWNLLLPACWSSRIWECMMHSWKNIVMHTHGNKGCTRTLQLLLPENPTFYDFQPKKLT